MTDYDDAIATVEELADWSQWSPFADVAATAPTSPGLYMFSSQKRTIYVGIAGPRDGNGAREPTGLRGRFDIYRGGRVTGFGQAIFDAALSDHGFVSTRLAELDTGSALRSVDWVRKAYDHYDPQVRWATLDTKLEARTLEKSIVNLLKPYDLLNREAILHRSRP
ncbi:hypothetical protein RCH16_003588 [Cryobacterium sp. MP_M5]|uniref:hypothetical protein n=1 Tax=unclassified Cryobacterium TaxID=2649013 RepID=UPI0018C8FEF0|nr:MULTISPECIES: hypothetical protein [unclassified Cryobacterium]MBG6060106.1 hypothetical protein [Cryobacterium sp. MP_M3]MEC5178549.1 hypothetical protein [Cryobacterium sp. MP_M5]